MKEIDNETLISAADKILDMLKKCGVGFSMPGQFNCSTEYLKFLIESQLKHPDRNQFEDFASIVHLNWKIAAWERSEESVSAKRRNLWIECHRINTSTEFIDLYLSNELCYCPTDTYRPRIEAYRAYLVDLRKQSEKAEKRREQRLARIAAKKEQESEKGESE